MTIRTSIRETAAGDVILVSFCAKMLSGVWIQPQKPHVEHLFLAHTLRRFGADRWSTFSVLPRSSAAKFEIRNSKFEMAFTFPFFLFTLVLIPAPRHPISPVTSSPRASRSLTSDL